MRCPLCVYLAVTGQTSMLHHTYVAFICDFSCAPEIAALTCAFAVHRLGAGTVAYYAAAQQHEMHAADPPCAVQHYWPHHYRFHHYCCYY